MQTDGVSLCIFIFILLILQTMTLILCFSFLKWYMLILIYGFTVMDKSFLQHSCQYILYLNLTRSLFAFTRRLSMIFCTYTCIAIDYLHYTCTVYDLLHLHIDCNWPIASTQMIFGICICIVINLLHFLMDCNWSFALRHGSY